MSEVPASGRVPAVDGGAKSPAGPLPFVTVVMPVRNESRFISRSVGSALAQDYPPERLEILVADGRSTDATRDIVESLRLRHPNLRLIDNAEGIVATGLNRAIRSASGEVIVRVDGHCEISPDYVRRCVMHLRAGEAEGVGGPLETVGETFTARVIAVAMSSGFGVGGAAFRTRTGVTMFVDTVAFPAYTREIIERAGPFDEELVRNQDDEYNYRLRGLGARILLAADVRSRYWSRGSLSRLWRQYHEYGFWKVRVLQKHPGQMKARQFAPPLFVASLVLGLLLAPYSVVSRAILAGITAAYVGANLTASVVNARGLGARAVPTLSAAFATLHLSYGLGFLLGLARFVNRWGDREMRHRTPVGENS